MSDVECIIGKKYGRLLVTKKSSQMYISPSGKRASQYECKCDCGSDITIKRSQLVTGKTKSCGCIHSEQLAKRNKKHGMAKTPEYISWLAMKARCLNPKASHYERYGGRGIRVCERWMHSFNDFYADMGIRPEGTSLDRIDPRGNYEPGNCRRANQKVQDNNKCNTIILTYRGIEKPLSEWAELFKIKYETLRHRISTHGWSVEKALTTPVTRGGEKTK